MSIIIIVEVVWNIQPTSKMTRRQGRCRKRAREFIKFDIQFDRSFQSFLIEASVASVCECVCFGFGQIQASITTSRSVFTWILGKLGKLLRMNEWINLRNCASSTAESIQRDGVIYCDECSWIWKREGGAKFRISNESTASPMAASLLITFDLHLTLWKCCKPATAHRPHKPLIERSNHEKILTNSVIFHFAVGFRSNGL